MREFNPKKKIEDVNDFNLYANEVYESFLESLHPEFTRPIEEGDCAEEGWDRIYTDRGSSLAIRMHSRLVKVGYSHYPDYLDEISSHLYQEP